MSGDGTVTTGSSVRLNWNPKLTAKKSKASVVLTFYINSVASNQSITCTENLYNTSKTITWSSTSKPSSTDIDTTSGNQETSNNAGDDPSGHEVPITPIIKETENITVLVNLGENEYDESTFGYTIYKGATNVTSNVTETSYEYDETENQVKIVLTPNTDVSGGVKSLLTFKPSITVQGSDPILLEEVEFYTIPYVTTPYAAVFRPTGEETDRLGRDISYTVQAYMKLITEETSITPVDWGRNFHIAVLNNRIEENVVPIAKTPIICQNTVNLPLFINGPMFLDKGTTNNHTDWTSSSNMTVTRGDEYTTLTPTGTSGNMCQTIDYATKVYEFDINLTFTGGTQTLLSFRQNGTARVESITANYLGLTSGEWSHVKLVIDGTTVTVYVDGESVGTRNLTNTSINRFYFTMNNSYYSSMKYKNFVAYNVQANNTPVIGNVQVETD
jgi:hypothetical protein